MASRPLPLSGTTVLALEQALAGPLCTRHLGDMGARVIKIERPGIGDFARTYDTTVNGLSSYFAWLNRGKESVSLDLKHSHAADVLRRLLAASDVVVQNLAPGAVDRLGVGAAAVLAADPRKIYCSISGYGAGGPYEQRKAFDLLLQGETGVIATTGNDAGMAKLGISVGDIGAGVYGAMAIIAALYERERSGRGQHVQSSLFDALAEWMGYPLYYTMYGGQPPARAGVRHATVVPYGAYRCGDGDQVLLAVQTEIQWRSFCTAVCERQEWIDDPRFATVSNRRLNRNDLEPMIEATFAALSRSEVTSRLEVADIPYGDLNTIEQFSRHPQLEARDRWQEIGTPGGTMQALLPPFDLDGRKPAMGDIPAVGEHTDDVLQELGFSENEITSFRDSGAM